MSQPPQQTQLDPARPAPTAHLVLPVLDKGLHPAGTWTAKKYTKKLVSTIKQSLQDSDEDSTYSHDFSY